MYYTGRHSMELKFLLSASFIFGLFGTSFYLHAQLEEVMSSNLKKIQSEFYPSLELAITNNNLLMQFDQHVQTAVTLSEEESLDDASKIAKNIDTNLTNLLAITTQHKVKTRQLKVGLREYAQHAEQLAIDFIESEKTMDELLSSAQKNSSDFSRLVNEFNALKNQLEIEFEQMVSETLQEGVVARKRFIWFNIIGLTGLMLMGGYAWRSSSLMSRNLKAVSKSLEGFADGDGDLSVRIEYQGRDELAELVRGFNRFVERLQGSMKHTTNNIAKLVEITQRLQNNSNRNLASSEQQATEVSETSRSINEMVRAIHSITESAVEASNEATEANQNAIDGNSIIENTITSITSLASEVESSADVVNQLVSYTSKVGGAINIIGDIAEQTNLLALNAAIEAARAGEQGRGFAVVADEVRNLASRTQDSTADIKGMLEELNKISETASQAMHRGVIQANDGVKESYSAVEALANITQKVSAINTINERIASAAEQQRSSSHLIENSISTIEVSSSEVRNNADELDQISHQIQSVSDELMSFTKQFRI